MFAVSLTDVHWFHITGIRGELHVQIRVKFIQDINRFRQSSCGVQFFSCLLFFVPWAGDGL